MWVSEEEIAALARRLSMGQDEFRRRFTRQVVGIGISLIEKPNDDCVLYDRRHGCAAYEDRPRQCRSWPFWRNVVETPESWDYEAKECRGMNQGRHYCGAEIRAIAADDGLP